MCVVSCRFTSTGPVYSYVSFQPMLPLPLGTNLLVNSVTAGISRLFCLVDTARFMLEEPVRTLCFLEACDTVLLGSV